MGRAGTLACVRPRAQVSPNELTGGPELLLSSPHRLELTVSHDFVEVTHATTTAWLADLKVVRAVPDARTAGGDSTRQEFRPYGVRNDTGLALQLQSSTVFGSTRWPMTLQPGEEGRFALHDWRDLERKVRQRARCRTAAPR